MKTDKGMMRALVRGTYDIQDLRKRIGLRIVANFKVKLGFPPATKQDKNKDTEAQKLLKVLERSHDMMSEQVAKMSKRKKIKGDGIIDTRVEYDLIDSFLKMQEQEELYFKNVGLALPDFEIWNEFLKDVKGVGRAMAGIIISEIDISRAKYASSLWKYAGLDVASDGQGRSKRKEHLVVVEYKNAKGDMATRNSITYNPLLKTKLVGVLAGSFLRSDSPYRKFYDDYKLRLQNTPAHDEKSDGHRHNMAMRYMIKIFLIDLYTAWRKLEGLPVFPSYAESKLGLKHGEKEPA